MITSYKQLLEETLAKFEKATMLNRFGVNDELPEGKTLCLYAPIAKGAIGCAIGCHLQLKDAVWIDTGATGATGIRSIYYPYQNIFDKIFDVEAIGVENMLLLQEMHDTAFDLDDFRISLRLAIAAEDRLLAHTET